MIKARSLLILYSFILLLSIGCTDRQTPDYSGHRATDSILVYNFYKSINGLSLKDIDDLIRTDLQQLDSIYYIEYPTNINGYSVKAVVKGFRNVVSTDYMGKAYLWFSDSCSTRAILHTSFALADSIANHLKTRSVNKLDYDNRPVDYYNINQLGQFRNVPFAFFDIDFDGKKELLLRLPHVGQRGVSEYYPLVESSLDFNYFDDFINTTGNTDVMIGFDKYAYCPLLDDMTEYDEKNREVIVSETAGWDGNEKLYYKVKGENFNLYKIETFTMIWDQLVKRVTYLETDSIVEYFEADSTYEKSSEISLRGNIENNDSIFNKVDALISAHLDSEVYSYKFWENKTKGWVGVETCTHNSDYDYLGHEINVLEYWNWHLLKQISFYADTMLVNKLRKDIALAGSLLYSQYDFIDAYFSNESTRYDHYCMEKEQKRIINENLQDIYTVLTNGISKFQPRKITQMDKGRIPKVYY